ncbi:putative signal transduction protein [gamma proteobacterium IMCC2047]|nr:putative signal transduction protein [gamma proteobacterium IMCC2047]
MADNKVRRLPIVENGKLVGIVSLNDVLEAKPSAASSLSVWELNYLVANLKIKDIMCANVFSISPDATVGEAAKMMLEKKFSGIPVTENDKLIGIITESDIFRMLAGS